MVSHLQGCLRWRFIENCSKCSYRIHAVLDDQSNASMISPNLPNKLDTTGPYLKYLLTCSSGKEERSGQGVFSVMPLSMARRTYRLPQLVECTNIPQDKGEIETPEMVKQFPHLNEIAEEIQLQSKGCNSREQECPKKRPKGVSN